MQQPLSPRKFSRTKKQLFLLQQLDLEMTKTMRFTPELSCNLTIDLNSLVKTSIAKVGDTDSQQVNSQTALATSTEEEDSTIKQVNGSTLPSIEQLEISLLTT